MKPKLKKVLKIILGILVILTTTYFLGPKPSTPELEQLSFNLPDDLSLLEHKIITEESATKKESDKDAKLK